MARFAPFLLFFAAISRFSALAVASVHASGGETGFCHPLSTAPLRTERVLRQSLFRSLFSVGLRRFRYGMHAHIVRAFLAPDNANFPLTNQRDRRECVF